MTRLNQPLSAISIVFFGTPDFAVPSLDALAAAGVRIRLVVTSPDKPVGKNQIMRASAVKKAAEKHNLPIAAPTDLKDPTFIMRLRAFAADAFVLVAYGKIIPPEILAIPRMGMLNLHPSLLPRYRGASPVHQAILDGARETGVTIMQMDEKLDHGPILAQRRVDIPLKATEPELATELARHGAELLIETLASAIRGAAVKTPQNDLEATYAKILKREDGRLVWTRSAEALERQIRAFCRWPESFALWQKNQNLLRLKILTAEAVSESPNAPCGTVWHKAGIPLAVATANGSLAIRTLQLEGKKPATAEKFVRGHPDIIGATLS